MVGNRIGVDTDAIAIVGLAVAVLVTRLRAPQADLESKHAVNANQTWTHSMQCCGEVPPDPRTLRFPIPARSNTALWQDKRANSRKDRSERSVHFVRREMGANARWGVRALSR